MNEQAVREIFTKLGAIITNDHFVYTSGAHGNAYVNKDAIYPHTEETSKLCEALAQKFLEDDIEVVAAPAMGGVILSQWVAHHLSVLTNKEVLAVYTEKETIPTQGREGSFTETGTLVFKRGYDALVRNKRILVIEDTLNTGKSVGALIDAIRKIDGNIIGLGVLCDRDNVVAQELFQVPKFETLLQLQFEVWSEDECPLCAKGVPINVSIGKGKDFIIRKGI